MSHFQQHRPYSYKLQTFSLVWILLLFGGCKGTPPKEKDSPTETPVPETDRYKAPSVAAGYEGLAWGAPQKDVEKKFPNLQKKPESHTLHRKAVISGFPGQETFVFSKEGHLKEVELKVNPKLTPKNAARIARRYDTHYGPHEITRADKTQYQFVWSMQSTHIYFTYDLTDAWKTGPIIHFVPAPPELSEEALTPSGKWSRAAASVLSMGWHVAHTNTYEWVKDFTFSVVLAKDKSRRSLTLVVDKKTGKPTQFQESTFQDSGNTHPQEDFERALKVRLITVGGPVQILRHKKTVYLVFSDNSYISLSKKGKTTQTQAGGELPKEIIRPPLEPKSQATQ